MDLRKVEDLLRTPGKSKSRHQQLELRLVAIRATLAPAKTRFWEY